METTDITVQILIEIRDQVRQTNAQLTELKAETQHVRTDLGRRIDQTNRQLQITETRLATEISGLRGAIYELEPERRDVLDRLERCERDIVELRERSAR